MAAELDVSALQRDLKAFQGKLDGWAQRTVAAVDDARAESGQRIKSLQGKQRELEAQARELEDAGRALEQRLGKEQADLSKAQETVQHARAHADTLPPLLSEQRERAAEEAQVLHDRTAELAAAEQRQQARLRALQQARQLYSDRLGLKFHQEPGQKLRLVFTQIDPSSPAREFAFAVQIQGDHQYQVTDATPAVPDLEDLSEELSRTGDFSTFVRHMRAAFCRLL